MSERHQALMNQAYDRWKDHPEWSKEDFLDQLNGDEKIAVTTGNLNYQVCNGGFAQWYGNRYGTEETTWYLIRMLSQKSSGICMPATKTVIELLQEYSRLDFEDEEEEEDEEEDYSYLRSHDRAVYCTIQNRLDEMDTKFYEINDQFLIEVEIILQTLCKEISCLASCCQSQ